jgi:hypothetical protein
MAPAPFAYHARPKTGRAWQKFIFTLAAGSGKVKADAGRGKKGSGIFFHDVAGKRATAAMASAREAGATFLKKVPDPFFLLF